MRQIWRAAGATVPPHRHNSNSQRAGGKKLRNVKAVKIQQLKSLRLWYPYCRKGSFCKSVFIVMSYLKKLFVITWVCVMG